MSPRASTPSLTRRIALQTPLILLVAMRVRTGLYTGWTIKNVLTVDTPVVTSTAARVTVLMARLTLYRVVIVTGTEIGGVTR